MAFTCPIFGCWATYRTRICLRGSIYWYLASRFKTLFYTRVCASFLFSSMILPSNTVNAFFKNSFSAYNYPTNLSSSAILACSLYVLPLPLKAFSGSLRYSFFYFTTRDGCISFSRDTWASVFPISISLMTEILKSHVYFLLLFICCTTFLFISYFLT